MILFQANYDDLEKALKFNPVYPDLYCAGCLVAQTLKRYGYTNVRVTWGIIQTNEGNFSYDTNCYRLIKVFDEERFEQFNRYKRFVLRRRR